jgi:glycosyltransferase involved in cell wall biosynthesis
MGDGAFHLLTAGHLIELKGHHRVIEAAARLRAEGLDARVWIAGGAGRRGDYREQIVRTAERTGMGPYTRLLGELAPEDLAAAMTACDVFCLASSREGWPNVVNEALACGAPVAAARAGAVPEMLAEAGLGVIVDSNEPGALAEGLRRALASSWDRAEIARRGQARSWEQTAQEVAAVWRECLEGGRR